MFYVGIDIGKRHHEVGVLDDQGKPIGKTLRFANSKTGSEKLLEFINQHKLTPDNSVIGIEATGHYWLSIFSFVHKLGFKTTVFNPLHSYSLCHYFISNNIIYIIDAYLLEHYIH